MRIIQTKARNRKIKVLTPETIRTVMDQAESFDAKATLIQTLVPIAFDHFVDQLKAEVKERAGDFYSRTNEASRWGAQHGSIYLGDEKFRVKIPRLRNSEKNQEVPLKTYTALTSPRSLDETLMKKILLGLSTGRYEDVARQTPEAFGLSKSTVSRRFIRASKRKLEQFENRDLSKEDIVAVFIDGKTFAEDEILLAVGITLEGKKRALGFVQVASENHRPLEEFFEQLVKRGLKCEEGILFIIDGSKGIRKAVERVFQKYALVQRCQWHKRENVLSYLPKSLQPVFKQKLSEAWNEPEYAKAKEKLLRIRRELETINASAAASLEEGLEETLTLQRIELFKELGKSFRTTNVIESIFARIGERTDKVDYWKNSNQKRRWFAASILDTETRLRKVCGANHLKLLRMTLKRKLGLEALPVKEAA